MTMRDPDLKTRNTIHDRRTGSNTGWIVGAIAVLLLLGAFAFIWTNDSTTTAENTGNAGSTASNTNTTAPASTSGSANTTGAGSSAPASSTPPASAPAR